MNRCWAKGTHPRQVLWKRKSFLNMHLLNLTKPNMKSGSISVHTFPEWLNKYYDILFATNFINLSSPRFTFQKNPQIRIWPKFSSLHIVSFVIMLEESIPVKHEIVVHFIQIEPLPHALCCLWNGLWAAPSSLSIASKSFGSNMPPSSFNALICKAWWRTGSQAGQGSCRQPWKLEHTGTQTTYL